MMATAAPPNFVVIIADDMAWDDSGAYGNLGIRTPTIDRMAREGTRFTHAFLTTSSCSPSRISILTGRYPHATGAPELHIPLPEGQRFFTEALRQKGYHTGSAGKWHLGPNARDKFDATADGGGASGCENWVPLLKDRPRDQPFFFWFAAVDPHRGYRENAIERPHAPEDVRVPPYLVDSEATRRDLALYYDEITRMDTYIGAVLDELEAQGVAEDTLVLFLSDNGRPFPRCKTTLYDDGVRTPFIALWPSSGLRETTESRLVSAIDIAPTMLELAGCPLGPTFQGRSFADVFTGQPRRERAFVFAEHNWHDYQAYERMARSKGFTYIRNWRPDLPGTPPADAVNSASFAELKRVRDSGEASPAQRLCFEIPRPTEELYDMESDPHSLCNLANDPAFRDVLQRHRAALETWRQETGDFAADDLTPDGFHREQGHRLPGVSAPHPRIERYR